MVANKDALKQEKNTYKIQFKKKKQYSTSHTNKKLYIRVSNRFTHWTCPFYS